jgi:hypothetical protein
MFGRQTLLLLRLKAKRCGVWFKFLSRLDRGLVDLTIEVADRVQSLRLTEALLMVMRKIEDAFESKIPQAMRKIGLPLAHRLSLLAKKWGNPSAENWILDIRFVRFLAIMQLNNSEALYRS